VLLGCGVIFVDRLMSRGMFVVDLSSTTIGSWSLEYATMFTSLANLRVKISISCTI
jgi:hypothetical protein